MDRRHAVLLGYTTIRALGWSGLNQVEECGEIAFCKPSRQTETFESYMVLKQVHRGGPLCRWATRRAASAHHVVISAAKDETGHLQNAGRELPCQP